MPQRKGHGYTDYPDVARRVPGVILPLGLGGLNKNFACLHTATTTRMAICTVPTPSDLHGRIWRGHLFVREMPDEPPTIKAIERDDTLEPLSLIASHACRLPGVVDEYRHHLAAISTEPLRQCVNDVFAREDVFEAFWSAPAAPDHHHWPAGLAWHTLEVLRSLRAALANDPEDGLPWFAVERDLVMVAGWLHDIAECVDRGAPSTAGTETRRRTCSMHHHELIDDAMANLRRRDQRLADSLMALWSPIPSAATRAIRATALRRLLLESHRRSEASHVHPLSSREHILFDRLFPPRHL